MWFWKVMRFWFHWVVKRGLSARRLYCRDTSLWVGGFWFCRFKLSVWVSCSSGSVSSYLLLRVRIAVLWRMGCRAALSGHGGVVPSQMNLSKLVKIREWVKFPSARVYLKKGDGSLLVYFFVCSASACRIFDLRICRFTARVFSYKIGERMVIPENTATERFT